MLQGIQTTFTKQILMKSLRAALKHISFKRANKNLQKMNALMHSFCRDAFSQEGEDLLLLKLLQWKRDGFYLDVGCHHPWRYSNTALLNRDFGWHGMNIDPLPGTKILFDSVRPKDINIQCGVGDQETDLTYFIFDPPAYSTFDLQKVKQLEGQVKLIEKRLISVKPLDSILRETNSLDKTIDFMNIDVEGMELNVLKGMPFKTIRPHVICIEALRTKWSELGNIPAYVFLEETGYDAVAKTVNSLFFVDRQPN